MLTQLPIQVFVATHNSAQVPGIKGHLGSRAGLRAERLAPAVPGRPQWGVTNTGLHSPWLPGI